MRHQALPFQTAFRQQEGTKWPSERRLHSDAIFLVNCYMLKILFMIETSLRYCSLRRPVNANVGSGPFPALFGSQGSVVLETTH